MIAAQNGPFRYINPLIQAHNFNQQFMDKHAKERENHYLDMVKRGMDRKTAREIADKQVFGRTKQQLVKVDAVVEQLPIAPAPSTDSVSAPELGPAVAAEPVNKLGLTRQQTRLANTSASIKESPPDNQDMTYMHSIMCQLGLPRSKVDGIEFTRSCGNAGIYVRAGKIWDGTEWIQQPVPYGPMPRLVMTYLNTQALRSKSREIDVGDSASQFLRALGKSNTGGKTGSYTAMKNQLTALSACSITLGFATANTAITYDGKPISKFEAWIGHDEEGQRALWPGQIVLSHEYYATLIEHSVPLDLRAMNVLAKSALAMDIYAMLADRLHRIKGRPITLHWKSLWEQFGQEYTGPTAVKNFKKKFLSALKSVMAVYPTAKVKQVPGGIMLHSSPPPVPYRKLSS